MFGLVPAPVRAVAFDMIGTVFPLEPLRPRLVELGLPTSGLEGWFAAGLRDAFALAAAGDFKPFQDVLSGALDGVLAEEGLSPSPVRRKEVLDGLAELDMRPGADEAMAIARDGGKAVIALTNGSASTTRALLARAGIEGLVDHVVSVDEVKRSKPAPEVYRRAASVAGVEPVEAALVASHAWDITGAAAAGLRTAYLSADRPFAAVMRRPDVEAAWLPDCVRRLLGHRAGGD
jgi:2-haloacid dehalogenase